MADIYLITPTEVIEKTPLGGNIDENKYKFCILEAQNGTLRELLGDDLYDKIETDKEAAALAGNYLVLYEKFIVPILIHQTAVEYLHIGGVTVGNGGIYRHSPANATPAEQSEIKPLIDNEKNKVDMYVSRLLRWLLRVMPPEYKWQYENIVNPTQTNVSFNFDIVSNNNKAWNEKPDNRMDSCYGN